MASLLHLMPEYGRHGSEKAPLSLAELQRLRTRFAATYSQASALGGLDCTGLAARGETSGTHGDLYIAPCDDPLPGFGALGSTCLEDLRMSVTVHQARHSRPLVGLAWKLRDIKSKHERGCWAAMSSVVRYERHARLATEWALFL